MPEKNSTPIEAITHEDARRANIPTSELQALVPPAQQSAIKVAWSRRNPDLDPQLVWRGKFDGDDTLTVKAPPLYIQEKIHPKALVEDLLKTSRTGKEGLLAEEAAECQLNLFADFNGIPRGVDKTDFYRHEQNWTNRMILGDSLQVMASLAARENLRGKVQAIYIDPPYGIKFNSNFQWSTTSRDVKDGKADNFTREPEQVRAFRDTWRDGIHSYLGYLRDRFIVARDLLAESGSIFVQIGDENAHRVRAVMDEVFGEDNFVNMIAIKKKGSTLITESMFDYVLWYAKNREELKVNRLTEYRKSPQEDNKFNTLISDSGEMIRITNLKADEIYSYLSQGWKWARVNYPIVSQHPSETRSQDFTFHGLDKKCGSNRQWSFDVPDGLKRLEKAARLFDGGGASLGGIVYHNDRPAITIGNLWEDVKGEENPIYVVQTSWKVIQRCLLMATDPGDLVLDPTCGSGTTAYVAEQWGRRWITIDTSRVALALARARLMGARYPYYLMADSEEGARKEAELAGAPMRPGPFGKNVALGFVYGRVPHITLKSIANNTQIDEIWEKWQKALEPLRKKFNKLTGQRLEEWEIPREADKAWSAEAVEAHARWWQARLARQKEIDESIAARAEFEYLYDKPCEDRKKARVAGPFTVESISPHRVLGVGADDEILDLRPADCGQDFATMILDNLKTAGVQAARKEDKIKFASLTPWPGAMVCADGRYLEGENERRAAIFIGPEFGTVSRQDMVLAAREAAEAGFDLLVACGFNFEAQASELANLGRLPILKARMNAELHMPDALKNTGKGNLFVVFGEPDIEILPEGAGEMIRVKINGVDVYYPNSGEIRSDDAGGIACWFVDTDYNGESFFVRQAYFLGQNDPYKALKTTLRAEIDREAWESLHSDVSRPFPRPAKGRIAVKVINHLGDEVLKVFRV